LIPQNKSDHRVVLDYQNTKSFIGICVTFLAPMLELYLYTCWG